MTKEIKTWQSRFAEARAKLKAQGGDITPEKSLNFRCQALMEENEGLRNAMHEVYDLGIEWSEKTPNKFGWYWFFGDFSDQSPIVLQVFAVGASGYFHSGGEIYSCEECTGFWKELPIPPLPKKEVNP